VDLVTRSDLELLAERAQSEPHVSLFTPTNAFGDGVRTDPIRWKNLVTRTESVLTEGGMRAPDIADLLGPARAFCEDQRAWLRMSDGLAMFLRPGWHRMFRVPADVPDVAAIGDRFVIGPLLRIVASDSHFLVLTLSQRKVRLLEGSLQRVEELELAEVPTSLRELAAPPGPRSEVMAFPVSAGRRGPAVFYGQGAADDDFKKDEVRRFLRQVADGLREYLVDQELPMVLVGLDQMLSLYREVNRYPDVVEDAVRTNPDQLSAEELHAAAWPLVEEITARERETAGERFAQLHGTGRATTDPAKIEDAARHGRVDTLFLATDPWCWDQVAGSSTAIVQLGADEAFRHCELLDRVAVDTLRLGGHVHAVAAADVPGGGSVAAVFRY
jgi:Bacterial archaeo-eukaryotic release factor family 3